MESIVPPGTDRQDEDTAPRAHHPDCPVNYFTDMPQRCRCVFMSVLDGVKARARDERPERGA